MYIKIIDDKYFDTETNYVIIKSSIEERQLVIPQIKHKIPETIEEKAAWFDLHYFNKDEITENLKLDAEYQANELLLEQLK